MAQPQGLTLIAGRYTVTWNAVALGVLESNGSTDPALELSYLSEPVNQTDLWGDADLDHLIRGSQAFCQLICKEYKTGSIGAAWPFGTPAIAAPVGVYMGANYAQALVLTAISGTTASASPATVTATYACLAPNTPLHLLYGPTLRKVPIRWQLLPYTSSGDRHWSQT